MFKFESIEHDTIFNRLDFRTKLVMIVITTLIAFIWDSPITGGILALSISSACLLAGIKLEYFKLVIKVMFPFYVFLLITMGFFNVDQIKTLINRNTLTPVFSIPQTFWLIGGASMSQEGIIYALNIIFKTLTMILVIPLAIFTTDINQMVVGMVRVKIPYKIVFIFSSTLRFFPLLLGEIETIIEAQKLRGLAINKMGLILKTKMYSTVAVTLILNAMAKSQKLEIILQSKAFSGSSNRTYLHKSLLTITDYITIVLLILLLIIVLFFYFRFGVGKFAWLIYS
ncbi:MAG: energy-coupling factor transporter transmembrane component T family protein [cyanobacterium endosymbiont of Rhopalodia musculus]|uniref:energy-coupling factor transporter transmembrane component T family protein n=1 Tax=cyanobacterium endosymbiont of Epithemia clementina EcSB TaxID=3034674 RepID=UPI00247FB401|nr:energy-coupling factor transporter transmembrane component T [cyanobacterium endosymbiont of Epithemia clementina EcSB]WGT67616.1 energy-coupling factor transporter transmembrane component T [cyanobacterium endosymbiont of Epithemia clementina EcSB]